MKYEILPVISIYDLEEALTLQYGDDFLPDDHLASTLFGDNYMNDCYKRYNFDKLEEYTGKSWQNEAEIVFENCVKTFLQDLLPNYKTVLIDVSW